MFRSPGPEQPYHTAQCVSRAKNATTDRSEAGWMAASNAEFEFRDIIFECFHFNLGDDIDKHREL